jgi:hypothetical protein
VNTRFRIPTRPTPVSNVRTGGTSFRPLTATRAKLVPNQRTRTRTTRTAARTALVDGLRARLPIRRATR